MPWQVTKGGGTCPASKWAVVNKATGRTVGCHDSKKSANKQLAALNANVDETEGSSMTRQTLTEARPAAAASPVTGSPGRFLIDLITPGWGSSGYYAPDVLEAAGAARVFPSGTHMYVDHPTRSEEADRPERTVRDLAAVLTEDAHWDTEAGALIAEATVFGTCRDALTEMADAIGVSIRAFAEIEPGEAEGRKGPIVTQLVEGVSVDFVTHAGRGGRYEVLESARPAVVVERAIHAGVAEATANDTRDGLQTALRDTYGGEQSWIWVRDFDESNVWYEHETPDSSGCYQLGYSIDKNGAVTLSGGPVEVRARTEYVPITSSTTSEAGDNTMTDPDPVTPSPDPEPGPDPQTDPTPDAPAPPDPTSQEDPVTENQGAGGTAPAGSPRQVIEAQLAEMRGQVAQMAARERARHIIAETLGDAWLTPSVVTRLTGELIEALPIVNDTLDEQALRDQTTRARDRAEAEVAEALQAAGVGSPRGLAAMSAPVDAAGVDMSGQLEEQFKALGMSETAAKIAVKGR
jgi:hypothetical protein